MTQMPEPSNMSSYYETTAHLRPETKSLGADVTCDLCIIGGGVTGVSAALHAAEKGLKVVLLEARQIGWAASGRAGGWMVPTLAYDAAPMAKQIGEEKAKRYFAVAREAQRYAVSLIGTHGIECDLKRGGAYLAPSAAAFKEIQKNFALYSGTYGLENAEVVDAAGIEDVFGTQRYFGAILDHGLPLVHPLNYTLGLAKAAQAAGAELYEFTPAVGYSDDGECVTVRTTAGPSIRANKLLLCTNAYLGDMEPQLSSRFVAIYGNLTVTEPLSPAVRDSIFKRDYSGFEASHEPAYFRLTGDGRLLYSANCVTSGRDGNTALAIIKREMVKHFPQTEGLDVKHVSGGWFGMTITGDAPDIGMLSDNVHFAQAMPFPWASYHGSILTDYLVSGESQDYEFMKNIDRPIAFGGKAISRTVNLATSLIAGVRGLRARM
ncbi:Gamma-glutamylputrescine oxidoreductase [Pseudomonas fluorescens]|uniref:Gamma-glutamylputrescine oxidoreductase n=2 Tax=Pseudomonas fluorescens TaxID=294 RepID=A0A5E6WLA4_PSEFL|nr:Gamma-glutamylputrescine oxidoreductase [Pseudomonas fluorescens]